MIGTDFYTLMPLQTANHYSGLVDQFGYVLLGKFDTAATPDTTASVFQKGCLMVKTDAANLLGAIYQNTGTLAAPAWTLMPISGTGSDPLTNTHIFVGNASNVATDVALSGDATISNLGVLTIAANAITKAKQAVGIRSNFMTMFLDDTYTTTGGAAAEVIPVVGAVAGDKVIVSLYDNGTGNVSIVSAVAGTDQITVTFSADPQNDTVIAYQVLRATS